jgi:hypothetical protein
MTLVESLLCAQAEIVAESLVFGLRQFRIGRAASDDGPYVNPGLEKAPAARADACSLAWNTS